MNKLIVLLIIGLAVSAAAGFLAFQKYKVQQAVNPQVQEVKECSSCTARHKAYSKAKKSWAKTKESEN